MENGAKIGVKGTKRILLEHTQAKIIEEKRKNFPSKRMNILMSILVSNRWKSNLNCGEYRRNSEKKFEEDARRLSVSCVETKNIRNLRRTALK